MFQAPRPISHAPMNSYFTPSAHIIQTPFTSSHTSQPQTNSHTTTTTTNTLHHTVAVPLAVSNAHRPIAISAHRGSGSGPNSASHSSRSISLHFASRVQPSDPTRQDQSPSASPNIPTNGTGSASASASPAVYGLTHPGTTHSAMGLGFSLSTPSPPPAITGTHTAGDTPIVPSSPLMSPSWSTHHTHHHPLDRDRRDSVDETEQASAHLQGILWRNAATLRATATIRHPQTPMVQTHHGISSPVRSAMSPLAGATTPHAHPSTPPGQSQGGFSRAIPIAKRSGGTLPLQLSILGQLQHHEEALGTSQSHVYSNASREGSRRGSGSGTLPQSTFHGSNSPLASSSSLGSSYILSQTPPVRAVNPLIMDTCFSPAQQAEYLIKQQSEYDVLPMMIATGGGYGYQKQPSHTSVTQSPVLRSTLSLSLAQRPPSNRIGAPPFNKFGSPHLSSTGAFPVGPPTLTLQEHPIDEDQVEYTKLSSTL